MIWIAHLILVGFNVTNAYIDAYKIKTLNKEIKHGINFGAYIICVVTCAFLFEMSFLQWLIYLFSAFFNRQITFDIPLNLRRGKAWDYMSTANPPKAWWDSVEQEIVGYNGRGLTIIYLISWIISLVMFIPTTI